MNRKSPTKNPSLLLVDDDRNLVQSMAEWLGDQGFETFTATNIAAAEKILAREKIDVALVDIRLGNEDGFDLLNSCRKGNSDLTVIMMTGYGNIDMGVEAIRAGAFDLLTKPLIDDELLMSIDRAISQHEVIEENRNLQSQLDDRFGLENIVGQDARMRRTFEVIDSVADTRTTILVTGQSGTGKSLLARAIHRRSSRRNGPFVEVACGALPENLLESELFGHVAGAFTGATGNKEGKFKLADGGTIFLDEIGTASPAMQVKLLRVLQELEFEQVGGTKTIKIDTRVILATNEDLADAVATGRFRQDLYYRINVINLQLPSLKERPSDIPSLAEHFLKNVCRETGRHYDGFEPETMSILQAYTWPGNVRELQNVIERAVLLGKGNRIAVVDLPANVTTGKHMNLVAPTASIGQRLTLKEALEGPERQIILQSLRENNWCRNATADQLGINRTTLYKKMRKLGLETPNFVYND
ncbi:MAG: sigma-54 dependent transcriptional regulator [Pirellulaceae bacterium]